MKAQDEVVGLASSNRPAPSASSRVSIASMQDRI